jgi:hypothetical protein
MAIGPVKFNPLDEGTGAITDTHNGNSDWLFLHKGSTFLKNILIDSQAIQIIVFHTKCQEIWDKNCSQEIISLDIFVFI